MNIEDKITAISSNNSKIAENQQKIYDKGLGDGAKNEYDKFWNGFQNFGNRTGYDKAFQYWGAEYIEPKHKIVPTSAASYLFAYNENLKAIYKKDFDLSGVPYATTWNSGIYGLCRECKSLEYFEDINIQPNLHIGYMFYLCSKLKKIEMLRVDENTQFNGTFHFCNALEEIYFDGIIASRGNNNNTFSFPHSTKLKKECVLRIFEDNLKDFSGTDLTANIGFTREVVNQLTDTEKAIATQKGWSIYISN